MSSVASSNTNRNTPLQPGAGVEKLRIFIAGLDLAELASLAADKAGGVFEQQVLSTHLETFSNEAIVGLELIAPYLAERRRILEVGCGVGILTHFLQAQGFDVVGIEPGADGFGFMPVIRAAITDQISASARADELLIGAEKLDPSEHGQFDLIFSVNVMEHIMELEEAMKAMSDVLAPTGMMVHLCANYRFPYEPHLGIPIVPGAPKLTRYVFPAAIGRQQRVWNNINFITASRADRLARRNGLRLRLEPGAMAQFFDRLRSDSMFRSRHPGLIGRLADSRLLGRTVSGMLRLIPAQLATPMIMTLSRDDHA